MRLYPWIREGVKWSVVVWLLYPMVHAADHPVYFPRIMLGILLMVIFTGKLFYDKMLDQSRPDRRRSQKSELLSLFGIIIAIAFVVAIGIFFAGYLMIQMLQQGQPSP